MKKRSIRSFSKMCDFSRKALVVEQGEEMPALTISNFVLENRFASQLATIGRYPFIWVMEPPMNATRPVLFFPN